MRRAGPLGIGIRLPRAAIVAVLGSCALVLAACGDPKYQYLQDKDVGAYFKVPSAWTVLSEDQMRAADPTLSPSERAARKANGWVVGASGRLLRQSDGSLAPDPSRPWVVANVFALSQQGHDVMSNEVMATVLTDLSKLPADQYTNFGTQDVVLDGGYHGIRRAFELRNDDGTYSDNVEQVLTNPQTSLLYTLRILCTPDCFNQYNGDISAVLGSWTIKEP
jgi:hypothetical protein